MKVILASSSPRRHEILSLSGIDFKVINPDTEEIVDNTLPHGEIVMSIAEQKALAVAKDHKHDVVIGCDTMVVTGDIILGKPKDEKHAFEMLKMLSGKTHKAYTGVTVVYNDKISKFYESTDITFGVLTDDMINKYIATKESFDKAGGYAIQGYAAAFVEKINGNFMNVMGLPLPPLIKAIREICPDVTGYLF